MVDSLAVCFCKSSCSPFLVPLSLRATPWRMQVATRELSLQKLPCFVVERKSMQTFFDGLIQKSTSQEHYQILSFVSVRFHFGLMTTPFLLIYNESWNKIKSRSIWYNNWISRCLCGSALVNLMSKNNRQKLDSCKI